MTLVLEYALAFFVISAGLSLTAFSALILMVIWTGDGK